MIMQWKYAIMKVLQDHVGLMHYTEIADSVMNQELRDRYGATPANTVNVYLFKNPYLFEYLDNDESSGWRLKEIVPENELAEMKRQFVIRDEILRRKAAALQLDDSQEDTGQEEIIGDDEQDDISEDTPSDMESLDAQKKTNFVTSKGIMWKRDACTIDSKGMRLYGIQNTKELTQYIDFTYQVGIYILYMDKNPVYVGQAIKQSLGIRLKQHTVDRLRSSWNRFSWFGIKPIDNNGQLVDLEDQAYSTKALINGLEGVLIDIVGIANLRNGNGMAETPCLQYKIEKGAKEIQVSIGSIVEEFYGDTAERMRAYLPTID